MISFISGRIIDINNNTLILENGGIGYEVLISANTAASLHGKENVQIFTYMHVKEDGISLYGFSQMSEKEMFMHLISVNSVGPKLALSVLSGLRVNDIYSAIIFEDVDALCKVKGLGKKTAERIILELKTKLSAQDFDTSANVGGIPANNLTADAILALTQLGFSKAEAASLVSKVIKPDSKIEDIVLAALKEANE